IPRRHHLSRNPPVRPRAPRLLRGDLDGRDRGSAGPVRRPLRGPHGRRDRRIPPLLLAPLLQDEPGRPVPPCPPGPELRAARRPLVGGDPPPPPPPLRHRARRPLAAPPRLPLLPRGVDLRAPQRRGRLLDRPRPDPLPRAGLARAAPLHRGGGARGRLLPAGRLARTRRRLLLEYRAPLPRHLHDQLAGACARHSAL